MKISALKTNVKPNFKGLWGHTEQRTNFNPKTGLYEIREEKIYFPFSDEDKKEVQDFVKGRTFTHDDYCSRTKCITKKGDTLPFTETEYWKYLDLNTSSNASNEQWSIHYKVQNLYLTSEANNQETAANINFDF